MTLVNIEIDENVVLEKVSQKVSSDFLQVLDKFQQLQPPRRLLGLIARDELLDELGISAPTVLRWEDAGLKRFQPPLDNARSIYYKIDDVLNFLTTE